MLLLERMDVHRWSAHSGPNPTQQRPARIPSGLPELYRVPNNWVVESLSCPRHSSYTSSRSPPKRCGHCINTVRAHEHGPALASSKANFVELRHRELLRIPLPRTSVNKPAHTPWHPLDTTCSRKNHPFRGCADPHSPLRCPCGRGVRPPYAHKELVPMSRPLW